MTAKPGTRIETLGLSAMGGFPGVQPEAGVIVKPRRVNLPMPNGYQLVRLVADGGQLLIHENGFRIISN